MYASVKNQGSGGNVVQAMNEKVWKTDLGDCAFIVSCHKYCRDF